MNGSQVQHGRRAGTPQAMQGLQQNLYGNEDGWEQVPGDWELTAMREQYEQLLQKYTEAAASLEWIQEQQLAAVKQTASASTQTNSAPAPMKPKTAAVGIQAVEGKVAAASIATQMHPPSTTSEGTQMDPKETSEIATQMDPPEAEVAPATRKTTPPKPPKPRGATVGPLVPRHRFDTGGHPAAQVKQVKVRPAPPSLKDRSPSPSVAAQASLVLNGCRKTLKRGKKGDK
jgi:hypothetical protein